MIDSILGELAKTTFDFRAYANRSDPLWPLFEERVPYDRLKFAIAEALQPKSILEVGVHFGYSARASMTHFLYRFRDVLAWCCVIPGYAGELLIHVTPDYLEQMAHTRAGRKDSARLRETYASACYLQDCGGFDRYARTGGQTLRGCHPGDWLNLGAYYIRINSGIKHLETFDMEEALNFSIVEYKERSARQGEEAVSRLCFRACPGKNAAAQPGRPCCCWRGKIKCAVVWPRGSLPILRKLERRVSPRCAAMVNVTI
jgi:hypothetical protein